MPGMDGTGPLGAGPQGRGRGGCKQAGGLSQGFGKQRRKGLFFGKGKGFGWGRGFFSNTAQNRQGLSKDEEVAFLLNQLSDIQSRLDSLKNEKE